MSVRYTTGDYLRDSNWIFDSVLTFWENLKPKLTKFYEKAIEFEYEEYIFRIAYNLPYALLIFYLGFLAVFTLARYTERSNGVRVSTITTSSMSPAIEVGSIVITMPARDYQKGDIISYKEENSNTRLETGRIITHRIVAVRKNEDQVLFTTKGDSNEYPDAKDIRKEQILGKAAIVIPYLGYLDIILRTVPGFLVFVVAPAIILLKNEISYIKLYFVNNKDKKL